MAWISFEQGAQSDIKVDTDVIDDKLVCRSLKFGAGMFHFEEAKIWCTTKTTGLNGLESLNLEVHLDTCNILTQVGESLSDLCPLGPARQVESFSIPLSVYLYLYGSFSG